MAGISSKAVGKLENRNKYNGNELQSKEFSDGSGLEFYDFNARTYDQQIGRFIQIDPETEFLQESFSPFHFGYNNPIRYGDPDGRIPIPLIVIGVKFLVGAAIEYGSQVYDNYKDGKKGGDMWKPQGAGGVGKIVLNGATSTVDPSGGLGKKIIIGTTTNVVESVGGQILDGKKVDPGQTVKDVLVSTVAGNAKVDGSKTVSSFEKNADKLERVTRNSPSARNGAQAAEARNAANKANIRNETAGTATTETTESAINKKTSNISFGSSGNASFYNPNAPRLDNTYTKKPVLLQIPQ